MRTPGFWYRPPGLLAALLAPISPLYGHATARRIARPPRYRAAFPVLSVGNLVAGGAGKTPITQALADHLGPGCVILARGHGGRCTGPHRVNPATDSARDVGDEPLMLARAGHSVWVARDRAAGARAIAAAGGCTALVLDDGHQNPDLDKSLSLLVVDAASGFGNGHVLPAGPLREPVAAGLARADAVIRLHRPGLGVEAPMPAMRCPMLDAALIATPPPDLPPGSTVFGFAGIARPETFRATLRALGYRLAGFLPLADHQPIDAARLDRLRAKAAGAPLVTTAKDAVRLEDPGAVHVVQATARFTDPTALSRLLAEAGITP